MDLTYSPAAERYRADLRDWLADLLPAGWEGLGALAPDEARRFRREWRAALVARGDLASHWPAELGGGGRTPEETAVLIEELVRAGLPHRPLATDAFGIDLLGNTIMHWGSDQQRRHFLPRVLSGEDRWCQGYSEPEAGSDLAHLRTRAQLRGDEWAIDGQKIWVTLAHEADWVFVLARTNRDAPPHRGISLLLVPMDQPGVDVRPIETLSGDPEFNEIFFDDARTAKENVVGEVDAGWTVALTLLGFERGAMATHWAASSRVELDRLVALAKERGRTADPLIRQRIAWCHSKVEIQRYIAQRAVTSMMAGGPPGADASIAKLYGAEYHQAVTELALDVLGMDATVPDGAPAPHVLTAQPLGTPSSSRAWVATFLGARAGTIYGGTSQIQRNIIGESVLGLPREPRVQRAGKGAR